MTFYFSLTIHLLFNALDFEINRRTILIGESRCEIDSNAKLNWTKE